MTEAKIEFDTKRRIFHLSNGNISYLMQVDAGDVLGHLYFGKVIHTYHNARQTPHYYRAFSPNLPGDPGKVDRGFSKDVLNQEYSGNQTGDFRTPAIVIKAINGATATDFRYQSYEIMAGKPHLAGLPQTYVENPEEAKTLVITLRDQTLDADLQLNYTIYADRPVITRSAKLINHGKDAFRIEKMVSCQLDFPELDLQAISLPGAHLRERQIQRQNIPQGITEFASRRGTSSHHMNPFMALVRPETTETSGEATGIQLVYSGNHQFTLEKDYVSQMHVQAGINHNDFEWQLKPGASFQTPEAILVYSQKGLNGMSNVFHHLLRERVARGKFQFAKRPVVINNWEATYFDFNADKIMKIVNKAADLGVELFVLDDGWFGKRDDDYRSLGDWYEYTQKLQQSKGLGGLAKQVHAKGMKFGLWFEPEMISVDSDLYRAHPDYALRVPHRAMSPSRDQFVLDFSRPEVVDNIFHQMCHVLDSETIDYVKWDMNRHLTEVYSNGLPADRQGEVAHRYMLGVYDLAERLTQRYPNILFEGCSGGGGRFDAGMLYYFPQSWTSDNTDPVERLRIQYGTSLAYPISSLTAHVAASPNHQNGRMTSLDMRGAVAFSGVFGYELDPNKLTDKEQATIARQIKFYKAHRQLIQYGDFYRLKSPFTGNEPAWEFVSSDQSEVLLFNFKVLASAQPTFSLTKLTNLDPKGLYQDQTGQQYGGDELMNLGLYNLPQMLGEYNSVPIQRGDFTADIKYFKKIN